MIPTNTAETPATSTSTPEPIAVTGPMAAGGSCIPDNPAQTGKVVDVVDGDTIKVLLDEDGQTYTVRYIGMDTPESTTQVEYFGAEASARNAQLVFGKPVTLIKDVSEMDRYGRLLRYVIVDGLFINYELVAQGYANAASFPPDVACIPTFQEAEQKARTSSLGLWYAPPTLEVVIPTLSTPNGAGVLPVTVPVLTWIAKQISRLMRKRKPATIIVSRKDMTMCSIWMEMTMMDWLVKACLNRLTGHCEPPKAFAKQSPR